MKVKREQFYKQIQPGVLILIWCVLFMLPLFNVESEASFSWDTIFSVWKLLMPFLVLFLVNRFVLLPLFFFRNKKALFLIINGCLIIISSVFVSELQTLDKHGRRPQSEERMHERPLPPIQGSGERLHRPLGNRMEGMPHGMRNQPAPPHPLPPFLSFIIIAVLMIGADTGLMIVSRWERAERRRIRSEKESTDNKMAFLRNQLSPHFFMNTLNNIHALIDISKEEAQEAVIRLSKLMSYMLYETQTERVLLQKEMDFVSSYLELMRLRISNKVIINIEMPEVIPEMSVPPLLAISYIENAFKYGVSYQEESYISIKFEVVDGALYFEVENSNHAEQSKNGNSGLGMLNAKNRLDLIYGEAYHLDINESKAIFKVKLKIPSC